MSNSQYHSLRRKFKGFTLVELIVVITILAILGTIGFLSIGGYSSKARDSARIGDLAQVSKSLDLSMVTSGAYPMPDNSFAVTYSGGAVWNQGTVWPLVMQYFKGTIAGGGINKKPMDPLKNSEYTYSSLAEGKAYQVKAEYEGELAQGSMNGESLVDTALAAAWSPSIAYIRGNFGGLTAKVTVGTGVYVIAVPSIVTNSGAAWVPAEIRGTSALSGTLLFNGKPLQGASSFNPNQVAYSGSKTTANPSGLPNTASGILDMMTVLKATYGASDIQSNQNIATLMNTATGGLTAFGTSVISAQLGGSASAPTATALTGSVSPVPCSPGTYSVSGNAPCITASAGNYVSSTWATSQTSASVGYYVSSVWAMIQVQCTAGYYGSTTWNIAGTCNGSCTAGYYCPAGSTSATQTLCPANSYCPAGAGNFIACSSGMSPAGSSNSSQCTLAGVYEGINYYLAPVTSSPSFAASFNACRSVRSNGYIAWIGGRSSNGWIGGDYWYVKPASQLGSTSCHTSITAQTNSLWTQLWANQSTSAIYTLCCDDIWCCGWGSSSWAWVVYQGNWGNSAAYGCASVTANVAPNFTATTTYILCTY